MYVVFRVYNIVGSDMIVVKSKQGRAKGIWRWITSIKIIKSILPETAKRGDNTVRSAHCIETVGCAKQLPTVT